MDMFGRNRNADLPAGTPDWPAVGPSTGPSAGVHLPGINNLPGAAPEHRNAMQYQRTRATHYCKVAASARRITRRRLTHTALRFAVESPR